MQMENSQFLKEVQIASISLHYSYLLDSLQGIQYSKDFLKDSSLHHIFGRHYLLDSQYSFWDK